MSRIGKIARRTFLIGSAAIVGGVAFGYYAYHRPAKNPLMDDLAEGEAALTPYVKIDASGITLITPRADLGQGAYHIQAALIAEELDVDLDQVVVDPGPPSPAYYNTALAGDVVPFPATETGMVAETTRDVGDAVMKFIGMQITGGSTTVPDGFEKLRLAGAVARETLKLAAAEVSGVAVNELKTARGAVQLPDGSELTYVELAPVAAELEPVDRVALRDPSQWRLIGKEMQRLDILAKSTGTQQYGIDFEIEGMVHAAVKLNPRLGGPVNSYDASAAEAMPGVQKIVPVTGGVGVIANNTWRAIQAANAIEADWGTAPYPAEMEGHWQALSNSFTDEFRDGRMRNDGDVEANFGDAPIEVEYRAPYLGHAPLEPINATVLVEDDRVDVWTGTQIPRFVQNNVAKITGVDKDNVHVHVLMMGGSFGHRLEDDVVKRCAEIAKKIKGTPVKLTYSREEDMTQDFLRPIAMGRMKGAVANGQVTACDLHLAAPSVLASQMADRQGIPVAGPDVTIIQAAWDQPYGIPNYRVTGYKTPGLAPVSSWRSVGASQNGFFHESFLDELIHAAGADPLEERIRLMQHEPSRKVLEAVGEMSNWGSDLAPGKGRGVAYCMSFGALVAEVVEVTNTDDGIRIDKVWVATDVGRVLDPINFDNLVKGGVIFGIGHAMNCEVTFSDGMIEQDNYYAYEAMRMYQVPEIEVRALQNQTKIRGIGEPPVPPAAPALGNAIFAATGQRIREMPFNKHIAFV